MPSRPLLTSISTALLPSVVLFAPAASYCYEIHYLDIAEAQKLLFPAATEFSRLNFTLTSEEESQLSSNADSSLKGRHLRVWEAKAQGSVLGYFFVDDVIGKHEYITYAVALTLDGKIQGVELLDYREIKGGEIVSQSWRDQFIDKSLDDSLRVGDDIANISGATLSCKHVTEGVRQVLAFFQLKLKV